MTNERMTLNPKFLPMVEAVNLCFPIMTTNTPFSDWMDMNVKSDRRWCLLFCTTYWMDHPDFFKSRF